ncbi:pilus assembly protein CpaB [Caballeronia jiangsuensis]|nr:pilus assembly protein CpaB [Caballeronia jiangsuensis]
MSNIIKISLLFIGAILITLIVRTAIATASHPSKPDVALAKVRVGNADLPQGLLLRDDDITWKQIPVAEVPPHAVISGAPGPVELIGAVLRHPIVSGAVVVTDDVILPNAPGFLAAAVKPGMLAVSVAVDDVSGNAGLIQPGDYVDLLLTQQMDRRTDLPNLAVSSETIVEQVRVLAVGSEINRPKIGDAPDSNNRARTVTLEVTPRKGEVVSGASRLGSLSLALRSFATVTREPAIAAPAASQPAPVWAGDVSRAVRDLPGKHAPQGVATNKPEPAPPAIHVYRGSEEGGMTSVYRGDEKRAHVNPSQNYVNPSPTLVDSSPTTVVNSVPQGAIDVTTGQYLPPAAGGVINPQTGAFYQSVGGGYVNTQNGSFVPAVP